MNVYFTAATVFLGTITLGVLLGALMAFPTMWLWNFVLPNLFVNPVVKELDFWSAWGLLVLCGLLFKSSVSSSNK